jgi:hypothetical protein
MNEVSVIIESDKYQGLSKEAELEEKERLIETRSYLHFQKFEKLKNFFPKVLIDKIFDFDFILYDINVFDYNNTALVNAIKFSKGSFELEPSRNTLTPSKDFLSMIKVCFFIHFLKSYKNSPGTLILHELAQFVFKFLESNPTESNPDMPFKFLSDQDGGTPVVKFKTTLARSTFKTIEPFFQKNYNEAANMYKSYISTYEKIAYKKYKNSSNFEEICNFFKNPLPRTLLNSNAISL